MKLRAATVVEVKEAFKVGKCVDYKLIYSFLCVPSDLKSHIPLYFFLSKVFDTVFHGILLEKLPAHGLDWGTLCWVQTGRIVMPKEWW